MAIRAEELRIGNLVQHEIGVCTVNMLRGQDIGLYDEALELLGTTLKRVSGIPLTEEWLVRFGFSLIETDIPFERPKMKYWVNDGICLFFNESPPDNTWLVGFADCYFGKYSVVTTDWIYYVHTIQNIYHATKGRELTLSPPQR